MSAHVSLGYAQTMLYTDLAIHRPSCTQTCCTQTMLYTGLLYTDLPVHSFAIHRPCYTQACYTQTFLYTALLHKDLATHRLALHRPSCTQPCHTQPCYTHKNIMCYCWCRNTIYILACVSPLYLSYSILMMQADM